jgi:hypothetical protein
MPTAPAPNFATAASTFSRLRLQTFVHERLRDTETQPL